MSDEFKNAMIDTGKKLLEKSYEDMFRPAAKSFGNTISLIPRTVGVIFGGWEKWVLTRESEIKQLHE